MSTSAQPLADGELRQRQRETELDSRLDTPMTAIPGNGSSTSESITGSGIDNKEKKTFGRTPSGTGMNV